MKIELKSRKEEVMNMLNYVNMFIDEELSCGDCMDRNKLYELIDKKVELEIEKSKLS